MEEAGQVHIYSVSQDGCGIPNEQRMAENNEKVDKSKTGSYTYEVSEMKHKTEIWISGHYPEGIGKDQEIVTNV